MMNGVGSSTKTSLHPLLVPALSKSVLAFLFVAGNPPMSEASRGSERSMSGGVGGTRLSLDEGGDVCCSWSRCLCASKGGVRDLCSGNSGLFVSHSV